MSDGPSISVTVQEEGWSLHPSFHRAIAEGARFAGVPPRHVVELVLATSSVMRQLHRDHFGDDSDTDVITFPTDFPELGDGVPALAGEIFVGLAQVVENAREEGWSTSEELLYVIIHGFLHLRGWVDAGEVHRQKMFAEQDRILAHIRSLGIDTTRLVDSPVDDRGRLTCDHEETSR